MYKRLIKFGMVGALGTVVDWGFFGIASFLWADRVPVWVTTVIFQTIGYELGVFVNYLLCYYWAWKDRRGSFWMQCAGYHAAYFGTYGIRVTISTLGVWLTGASPKESPETYYLIFFASVGIAVILNFLLVEHKVFAKKVS